MSITTPDEAAPAPRSASSTRRFIINVASNLLMLVLNVVVGLWLTRYLVEQLGVALYGLVALATSVTLYMTVISTSLSNGVGRYLTIELKQGNVTAANRTFNTALWGSIGLCLVMLPGVALLAYAAPQIFSVPAGNEAGARWLFAAVMLGYLISIVRGIFAVSSFAHSRFDLQNLMLATNVIVRVLLLIALFTVVAPSLVSVGIATLLATVASFGVAMATWRRLTPELSITPQAFERSHLRTISGTSSWFFVNQIGTLLFLNIDLVVVNIFLGPEIAGRYGVVLQWPLLLRTLATTVSSVLTPIILTQYASNDLEAISRTTQQAVKLMGLALALPIGFIVGLATPILTIWLGADFADLAPLLMIMVAPLTINIAIQPLFSTQVALNRVRWPGIVTLLMGIGNVFIAIWWVEWLPNGMGVALAGIVLLSLKNIGFIPIYSAYIQNQPWYTFHRVLIPGVLATLGVALISYTMSRLVVVDTWLILIAIGMGLAGIYATVAYHFALDPAERTLIQQVIRRRTS
jgi:membrane protein EpsK